MPCRATGTALPDTPVIGDQGSPDYNSIVTISAQSDAALRSFQFSVFQFARRIALRASKDGFLEENVEFEMGCPPGPGIRNSDFHDPQKVDWSRYQCQNTHMPKISEWGPVSIYINPQWENGTANRRQ